ncbi:hypothetical protein CB457P1_00051 [Enterocloster phage CB457P1]|nr:hypothetical protein CB457P1_00051 [Enterocloster phage CB457P1]
MNFTKEDLKYLYKYLKSKQNKKIPSPTKMGEGFFITYFYT